MIQKASEVLKSSGVPVDGFYTEEVRQGGRRIGFDVVTLSGMRGVCLELGQSLRLENVNAESDSMWWI